MTIKEKLLATKTFIAAKWQIVKTTVKERRILPLFSILFILLAIPVTVSLSQHYQNTQQQASTNYVSLIKSHFNITVYNYHGTSDTRLKWMYDELTRVGKISKFVQLVKPLNMRVYLYMNGSSTSTAFHRTYLGYQLTTDDTFKTIMLHELSHAIRYFDSASASHKNSLPAVVKKEGYVTAYSRTLCLGANTYARHLDEDYAEMLAYYLRPNTTERTARCATNNLHPYWAGKHRGHFNLAKAILDLPKPTPTPTPTPTPLPLTTPIPTVVTPTLAPTPTDIPFPTDPPQDPSGQDIEIPEF